MESDTDHLVTRRCKKLYGRAVESGKMQSIFHSVAANQHHDAAMPQLVLVDGCSGAGKSALIRHVLSDVQESEEQFVSGTCQFSEGESDQRFDSIVQSFSDFASDIAQSTDSTISFLLNEELDNEDKESLVALCDELDEVLQFGDETDLQASGIMDEDVVFSNRSSRRRSDSGTDSVIGISSTAGYHHFRGLLRTFLRAMSSAVTVLWVMEDMQWIDEASLSVLQYLLQDKQLSNLVVIGAYRPDQVSVSFSRWMQANTEDNTTCQINLSVINEKAVEELVSDILEQSNVHELSKTIFARTKGRIFYVRSYIDYIQTEKLLEFCWERGQWIWDIDQLQANLTGVDDAAVDVALSRLESLSRKVYRCLQVAACIGQSFQVSTLDVALDGDYSSRAHASSNDLGLAMQQGLVEPLDKSTYSFSHKKIHDAFLHAMDTSARKQLHLDIGRSLVAEYLPTNSSRHLNILGDRSLFLCTQQLNKGRELLSREEMDEIIFLVRMNMTAGRRSSFLNAYRSTIEYFGISLELLKRYTSWNSAYQLLIDSYTGLAQAYLCVGNFDEIAQMVVEVKVHTSDVWQTFRAQYVWLQALIMINRVDVALDNAILILEEMGETWLKQLSQDIILQKRNRAIKQLSSLTDDAIFNLPEMTNRQKLAIVEILAGVVSQVMQLSDKYKRLIQVMQLRLLELTLEFGLSKWAPDAFSFAAFALFDDTDKLRFDTSMRVSHLAIKLAKRRSGSNWHREVTPDALVFHHWSRPYVYNVDHSFSMYETHLKNGRLVSAFQSVAVYLYTYYYSGMDLRPFVKDCNTIAAIQMSYGQKLRLLHMLPCYQVVLNLTGKSDDILDMYKGKAMDYRPKLGWGTGCRDGELTQWDFAMQLYVYCEAWDKASEMYDLLIDKDFGTIQAFPQWHNRVFFFALIAIHNTKRATWLKRPKVKKEIEKHVELMRFWVSERKAINLVHKLCILEAELLTIPKTPDLLTISTNRSKAPSDTELIEAYNKGIQVAAKIGNFQDAALGAALAVQSFKDETNKKHFAGLAQEFYARWGATGVIKHLQRACKNHQGVKVDRRNFHARGRRTQQRFSYDGTSLVSMLNADQPSQDVHAER